MIGRPLSILYGEEDRRGRRVEKLLAHARKHGRVEDESWRVRKGGGRVWCNVVLNALFNQRGELMGFIEISRGVMLKGAGWAELWPQFGILAAMFAALIALSIRRFSVRLD